MVVEPLNDTLVDYDSTNSDDDDAGDDVDLAIPLPRKRPHLDMNYSAFWK